MKHKKYHLIYFFSLLFFILSLVSTTTAQTSNLDSLDGKFALQFQISSNFQLKDFQGTTLSGKYHIGNKEALRLGVSIGFADQEAEVEENFFETDSLINSDLDQNYFMIGVRLQYIRYFFNTYNVGFYAGGGPSFTYDKVDQTEKRMPPFEYPIEQFREILSVGFNLLAGVEWMFTKNMSLSAEYGILFYYQTLDETRTYPYSYMPKKTKVNSDSFGIVSDRVNFGISIYF